MLELGAQIVDVDHASEAVSDRSILTPARRALTPFAQVSNEALSLAVTLRVAATQRTPKQHNRQG